MIPKSVKSLAADIRSMKIRGAGLIARTACKGLLLAAQHSTTVTADEFYNEMLTTAKFLNETRPSAVSLPNGLRFVLKRLKMAYDQGQEIDLLRDAVIQSATTFTKNSEAAVERIGEIGARRIRDGDILMTICNSSAAISTIIKAHADGKNIQVFATESRPKKQGYITVKELVKHQVPTTLIVDSAVRYVMQKVDLEFSSAADEL